MIGQQNARREDLGCVEEVELGGHIIDSLILPKVLDCIAANGGTFCIKKIVIGQARADPSYAVIEVRADNRRALEHVLAQIADHGATPLVAEDCRTAAADIAGAFPEDFYSTTNQRRNPGGGRLVAGGRPGDVVASSSIAARRRRCIPMNEVRVGDGS